MPSAMNSPVLHRFHPLNDPRWDEFLQQNSRSSVFHTANWLAALRKCYGFEPVAWTTSAPDRALQNAAVFCKVESWLTGSRLVGLPFSDHCDILTNNPADTPSIVHSARQTLPGLKYVEFRSTTPLDPAILGYHSTHAYCLHRLDLRPDIEILFRNLHAGSIQRKIRRAEREGLVYEEGRSAHLLDSFYRLLLLTRRRHLLPPQPRKWFESLIQCFGEALQIRVAFLDRRPVAAILTLRHKDTLVYKYGCSDAQLHNLGGMPFLFWRSIQDAKRDGLAVLDLGRSDFENGGLLIFKDRWGAQRSTLNYVRLFASPQSDARFKPVGVDWRNRLIEKVFPHLPDNVLRLAGSLIYKHVA